MLPICILAIEDENDREFMTRVFTQYQWLMYNTVNQVVNDHWQTEDLVQATVEKLIDKLEKLKTMDEQHMVNYIITACKHTAYNEMRYRSRHPIFSIDEEWDTPDGIYTTHSMGLKLSRGEEVQCMAAVWDKLDPRSQYVLEARYILDKTDDEIADFLGIKPDSVRMALTRARKNAYDLIGTFAYKRIFKAILA